MSKNFLRVPGYGKLRLSDITVNNPNESYKFRDIYVNTINVLLPDDRIGPASIQIIAKCALEVSRTNGSPEALGLAHEHNFKYKGVVDGKHRFECSCGAIREEELNGGHGSQQDPTGPDASNQ